MSDYIIHGDSLEDIADAIREKTGTSSPIAVGDMPDLIYGISGGDGHELYTVDNLLINSNYSVTSGTANVTKQYTLDGSIENYDAVVVMAWCYNTGLVQSNLMSSTIFAKDYYETAYSSGSASENPWLLNASANTARRAMAFQFNDATHITTVALRTESGIEPVIYKVEGVKFGRDVDHKEDTLWSGTLSAVGDVTLEHSINDYDEINVKWHCNNTSGVYTKYIKILVDDIDYTKTGQFCDSTQIIAAGSNYNAFISCYFKDSVTFNFSEKYAGPSFTPVIDEIIGIKYGGFNANTPFDMEQVFQESPTVTLTNNTLNTVKTITVEDEGYYFLSFVDEYQRSSNRSYLVVNGIQNECLIYNFGSHVGTDVLGDPSGYSWFAHTIMFRTFVPNTTVTLGLWGNGYNPSSVRITLYKMKGMFNGGEVVANPVGEPTDELNTIQIGNTIYEIAGGSKTLEEKVLVGSTVTATGSGSSATSVDKQNVIRAKLELWLWCPNVNQAGTVNIIINNEPHLVTEYTYYTYTDAYHAVRTYILDLDAMDVTQVGYSFSGLAYNSASQFHGEITLTWQEQAMPKLSQLSDVDINDIQDGQILKWNPTSQKFENANDGGGNSWTGTQAELEEVFDELEDGTQINIIDDEQEVVEGGTIYSEDEQIIGLWTDNRPLYQKTISCGALPNATTKFVSTGFESGKIDIVELSGYACRPSDNCIIPMPRASTGTGGLLDLISIQNDGYEKIRITTVANYSAFTESYATIKYTKTTDSPIDAVVGKSTMYIASSDCYSTEEKEIGCWLDGKPLYKRTVVFNNPASDRVDHLSHGITNIDTIVRYEWAAYDSVGTVISGFEGTASNWWSSMFNISKNDISYRIGSSWIMTKLIVTLCYTKTTDIAGSGRFVPSGDKAQHYSFEEQVIGTWVNNKPLYQKTIYIPSPVNDGYYDHYIENADRIIVSEVTGLRNNSWNCGVFNTTNNDRLTVLAHASRSQGVYVNFAMTSLKELYVTLKYTKTTD